MRQSDHAPQSFLRTVQRRWQVVLLAMVLVPAASLAVSASQTAEYEASAQVLLSQGSLDGAEAQTSSNPQNRGLKTQSQLAHSPFVAARVLATVPAEGESVRELLRSSSVTADPDADVLSFNVRNANTRLARRLANEFAHQYTLYLRRFDRGPSEQALAAVRRQLAELRRQFADEGSNSLDSRAALARKAQQLRTLEALDTPTQFVVNPAQSAAKTRPMTVRNGIVGLAFGTFFGLGLAFLRESLDNRMRSDTEISQALGLPLLARIPAHRRRFGPDVVPVALQEPRSREAEAFRFLRTNLEQATLGRDAKAIMVTSAHPGEGTSSVAANLAVTLARAGRHVTLVDLDLRKPSLARFFRLEARAGLTDVANGSASLDQALTTVGTPEPGVDDRHNGKAGGTLGVLPSGPVPAAVGEFYSTLALRSILGNVCGTSELVVVDSPPLLGLSDAVMLSGKVDALLLVVRWSVLRRSTLTELRRVLDSCPVEKLGFVLTQAGRDEASADDAYYESDSPNHARDPVTS